MFFSDGPGNREANTQSVVFGRKKSMAQMGFDAFADTDTGVFELNGDLIANQLNGDREYPCG